MRDTTFFRESLEKLDITLSQQQLEQFLTYYELLIEWNNVMNLTAITEYEEVILKHFIDSLTLIKVYDLTKPCRILDLGTGAGFPGVPLKIAFPNLEIVLLDSLNKRIKFLDEVIQKLELKSITAIHGRAEDFGKSSTYRETFDLCVSRAVANLASLSEYCIPYVKVGGYFIPYKSGKIQEEVDAAKNAVNILGAKINKVETFCLPGSDMERSFVLIKKGKNTAKTYPRSAGKPTKEPLV
jgi:16S rRNA (guanine527-N7)-methyltransferase